MNRGLLLLLLLVSMGVASAGASHKPVVLLNGLSGSLLEFRHTSSSSSWSVLWLDLFRETILRKDSLKKMSFRYDAATDGYRNASGVEVMTVFDDTGVIDYLIKVISHGFGPAKYMNDLIEFFEENGYKRNVDVRSGAYDWRYPFHKLDLWRSNLDSLIEKLYTENNGTRVAIIGHCQGGIVGVHYLAGKSQAWKDKYVDSFHAVAVPFLGTQMALHSVLSGCSEDYRVLGFDLLPLLPMRDAVRTLGSIAGLLPRREFSDEAIIVTGKRNYTTADMEQLLIDAGATDTLAQLKRSQEFASTPHPGVRTTCHVGKGIATHQVLGYPENDFEKQPKHVQDADGDGTVTVQSASWCKAWATMRPDLAFDFFEWESVEHTSIVQSRAVAEAIYASINTQQ